MKIEFKFLPITITSYNLGVSNLSPTDKCVVFPCFRCKHYIRDFFVKNDVFLVDVDNVTKDILNDECTKMTGFTRIVYQLNGSAVCPDFHRDHAIGRKL